MDLHQRPCASGASLRFRSITAAHRRALLCRQVILGAHTMLSNGTAVGHIGQVRGGLTCAVQCAQPVLLCAVIHGAHSWSDVAYAHSLQAMVAMTAHAFNVPVLVCCETYKFTDKCGYLYPQCDYLYP